ncbi:succinyl-diaminopimelate desuccinylase [Pelagibius sp.]|uniref:succinyl-diaminopimelate desuccinylase n=1 Tax=Pelagibius sp. TaxID=1931238 RepID=UPI002628B086|nr:succinyl-diaminopimelate desuccinylase [Pelagibius sp.]
MAPAPLDTLDLARGLIRCPSVTPAEAGSLSLLEEVLSGLGFACHRLPFAEEDSPEVDNLFARLGEAGPNLCFAGHTDVVPVGDPADWSVDPFAAELRDGCLYGRGAVDMKGSIAAFVAAVSAFLAEGGKPRGSLSLLITCDEEGVAINGTRKVLRWMREQGEQLDACLVGEPTSNARLGDMVKIGRRGSLNAEVVVAGTQGHTAYPQLADNPVHHLTRMLAALVNEPLDEGNAHFPPSSLQITSVDVGNAATNVIPPKATARFNVRFNDLYSSGSLETWLRERLDGAIDRARGAGYEMAIRVSGESFLCPPGPWSDLVSAAVAEVTGAAPELGTTGGTSDARFIKDHCAVAELGLLNATAHKVDEHVSLEDLTALTRIYRAVLDRHAAG